MSKTTLSLNPYPYRDKQPTGKVTTFISIVFGVSLFISIPLIFCTITLYWTTLVNGYSLLLLATIIGFSTTIIFRKRIDLLSENHDIPERIKLLSCCICNSFSLGTIIIFLILWSNQAFGGRSQTIMTLPVVSSGYTSGHRNSVPVPFVEVVYKHKTFSKLYPRYADVRHIDSLSVIVTEGWLGLKVVHFD